MVRASASLVSSLYLFELFYREKMRFAMICHHTLTVFATSFVIILLDKTSDPSFILSGSLWLFQATTEQLTFIALFGYRLEWQPRILRPLLKIASIQSMIIKTTSIIACIYIWFKFQKQEIISASYNHGWDVVLWMAALGLMATQVWGSWVVWVMGTSLEARYEKKRENELLSSKIAKIEIKGDVEKQQQINDSIRNLMTTTILPHEIGANSGSSSLYHTYDSSPMNSKDNINQ